jgi:hypothetical protein
VRDGIILEGLGIKSVVLITEAFRREALAQIKALKREDLEIVFVPHPIAGLKVEEVMEFAHQYYPQIKEALMRNGFKQEVSV